MKKLGRAFVALAVALTTLVATAPSAHAAGWQAPDGDAVCGSSVYLRAGTYAQVCTSMTPGATWYRTVQSHVVIRQSGGTAKVTVDETRVYARGFVRSSGQWLGGWNLYRTGGCSTRTFYSRTSLECEGNPVSPNTGWAVGHDIKAYAQARIVVNGYGYVISGPTLNPWV